MKCIFHTPFCPIWTGTDLLKNKIINIYFPSDTGFMILLSNNTFMFVVIISDKESAFWK